VAKHKTIESHKEPFFFLHELPSTTITTIPPASLTQIKKEGINKALQSFVPPQYHAFWQDIISGTNSFIFNEPSPRQFELTSISRHINTPHNTHPGQSLATPSQSTSTSLLLVSPAASTNPPTPPQATSSTNVLPTETMPTNSVISLPTPPSTIIAIKNRRRKPGAGNYEYEN
jgi:hypothetical protein